jgi:hypothetical protein
MDHSASLTVLLVTNGLRHSWEQVTRLVDTSATIGSVVRWIGELPVWSFLVVALVVLALRGTLREVGDLLWCRNMKKRIERLARERDIYASMGGAEKAAWCEWQRLTMKEMLSDADSQVPSFFRWLLQELGFHILLPAEEEIDPILEEHDPIVSVRIEVLPVGKKALDAYNRRWQALVDAYYLARDQAFIQAKQAAIKKDALAVIEDFDAPPGTAAES